MSIDLIGLTLGTSFAAGLNVYATVATLGLLERFGLVSLPPSLAPLAHPVVIGLALLLYVVEFFADKIPFVDSIWDVIHTFVRPPAAAILAFAAVAGVPEPWRVAAALLAGGIALTSHGTKAATRAAVNTSPEPFSNSMLSVAEDLVAIFVSWVAAAFPVVAIVVVCALLILSVWILVKLFHLLRRVFRGSPIRAVPPTAALAAVLFAAHPAAQAVSDAQGLRFVALSPRVVEGALPDPDRRGGHLHQLVIVDPLDGRLDGEVPRRL
jgi:hypothetical protein